MTEADRMGWVYDVGYGPAYEHEGWAAAVLEDGTDVSGVGSAVEPMVIGWRAACDCGWRSPAFYSRAEWPSASGYAPEDVEGWEDDTNCYAEWEAHVGQVIPELELYRLIRQLDDARSRIDPAVSKARAAGASWSTIGRVTGMTRQSAHARWSGLES